MGIQVNKMAEVTLQLSDQKSTISHLESEVSSLQSIIETDRKRHTAEICELTVQLKEKEVESVKMADKYQWTSNRLEQVVSENGLYERENATFLERKNTLERNIEEKDIEIKTLKSDNNQLKKQLIKAIREKATLWQQSDTLAFEYKRKAHEKWMDSSKVTKCMGCNAEFSLFLRKHHCRLCGHIFCWSCSDNWVDSPSSSQKARACITCFKELQDLDSNISRLVVPEDSDDDTSNVDSEITSPSDLQADASASHLHEIVSLESLSPGAFISGNSSKASSVEDIYRTIDKSKMDSSNSILSDPTASDQTSNVTSGASISESQLKDCVFHVITQEEITKSVVAYDSSSVVQQSLINVPNMLSSILLYAEDLAVDRINKNSEIWVKPGHSVAIPICVDVAFTLISWEFTVHPKDIQFSITYHCNNSQPLSQAEIVLSPRRCNSVKEPIKGVLTAKKTGVYTLIFDNSYSRVTAKKIHYQLQSSRNN